VRVLEPSSPRDVGPLSAKDLIAGAAADGRAVSPVFAPLKEYAVAVAGVAALIVACWLLTPLIGYGPISLIFLLGVLLAGMVLNRGPVLLVAALSALSWNFLFIPPLFTLHIAKFEDALTFATYFIIALAVGSLTSRRASPTGPGIRAPAQDFARLCFARTQDAAGRYWRCQPGTGARRA
jgi:two-component system sensor histidine kinase KdpD